MIEQFNKLREPLIRKRHWILDLDLVEENEKLIKYLEEWIEREKKINKIIFWIRQKYKMEGRI